MKEIADTFSALLLLIAIALAVWIGVASDSWLLGLIALGAGITVAGGVGGGIAYFLTAEGEAKRAGQI